MKESREKQAGECAISPDKLKTILNKMRPSEPLDAPLLGDEHEEEIIDQRLVY